MVTCNHLVRFIKVNISKNERGVVRNQKLNGMTYGVYSEIGKKIVELQRK